MTRYPGVSSQAPQPPGYFLPTLRVGLVAVSRCVPRRPGVVITGPVDPLVLCSHFDFRLSARHRPAGQVPAGHSAVAGQDRICVFSCPLVFAWWSVVLPFSHPLHAPRSPCSQSLRIAPPISTFSFSNFGFPPDSQPSTAVQLAAARCGRRRVPVAGTGRGFR